MATRGAFGTKNVDRKHTDRIKATGGYAEQRMSTHYQTSKNEEVLNNTKVVCL